MLGWWEASHCQEHQVGRRRSTEGIHRRMTTTLKIPLGDPDWDVDIDNWWVVSTWLLFPTCQVRVVRFYQSCSPPPPPPHPPPPSPPPPPPRSPDPMWAQPDLHRERQIPVRTAGPPPRAQDPSGHCRTSTATSRLQWALRTSTATSRSQWALPDLNRDFQIAVGTAGPEPRAPDPSGHCRTSTAR